MLLSFLQLDCWIFWQFTKKNKQQQKWAIMQKYQKILYENL